MGNNEFQKYSESNLIFVGGFERSGTGLMRSILDSHANIKCGPELKIIPKLAEIVTYWTHDAKAVENFNSSGISVQLINKLTTQFIFNLINLHHNDKSQRLCNKDPHLMLHIKYLHSILPNAKFVLMFRDPRGSVLSYLPRYNFSVTASNFEDYLLYWNQLSTKMYEQCVELPDHCIIVKYENLVTKSRAEINHVVTFLNEPWDVNMLRHHELVGTEIELSRKEWSTEDVIKPINSLSLYPWTKNITFDINGYVKKHALNLFNKLNYTLDINLNNKVDDLIKGNNEMIEKNQNYWRQLAKKFSDFV